MNFDRPSLQLLQNERVILEARTFYPQRLSLLFSFALALLVWFSDHALGIMIMLFNFSCCLHWFVLIKTSGFYITNKRIISRAGVLTKRTTEMQLGKIESIYIETGIIDRIIRTGKLVVIGTGGTKETFSGIFQPEQFKTTLQQEVDGLTRT
jgi:uncharacterized membrane protein YdbT with pleckstrin-like domain